ncbi:MAG: FtsB family cell division protein [Acetobacteraceae bacterium]
MALVRALKRRLRAVAVPLSLLGLSGVFAYGTVRGDHGLVAYRQRAALLARTQAQLAQLQARQARWEIRVAALRSDHLDLDLLDARAREMLNLSNPRDILMPYPDGQRLF